MVDTALGARRGAAPPRPTGRGAGATSHGVDVLVEQIGGGRHRIAWRGGSSSSDPDNRAADWPAAPGSAQRVMGTVERMPEAIELHPWERRLGATALDDDAVEFRVWALNAERVRVRVGDDEHELTHVGDGIHEGRVDAHGGEDYVYLLGGDGRAGPARPRLAPPARSACAGRRGSSTPRRSPGPTPASSRTRSTSSSSTSCTSARSPARARSTPRSSTCPASPSSASPRSRSCRSPSSPACTAGATTASTCRAAQSSYGGPQGFQRLVDAAHASGLSVILDVVYNHVGASGNQALAAFGPYFTDRYSTFWGNAINYDDAYSEPVREWVLQSAEGWVRDFHVDGLRLDAIHAIYDTGAEPIMAQLADRVHAARDGALVIAESGLNDPQRHPPARAGRLRPRRASGPTTSTTPCACC